MRIGELAERVNLSHRTIRHYDDVGLLPASRTEGGYRLYTLSDMQRMLTIRVLKPLGFSLEQMRSFLDILDQVQASRPRAEVLDEFEHMRSEIRRKRDKMQQNLEKADELLGVLERFPECE